MPKCSGLMIWTAQALGLLTPENQTGSGDVEQHRLDAVCDLVGSAFERPFTLTEMEAISGLSARALQYGFKARFGCSPMEWQRRERIRLARNRLMFAAPGETITQIAYAMGFASSAAFAAQYRRYFGETPSQTFRLRG
jgi:AraC-like DNA-binding protein